VSMAALAPDALEQAISLDSRFGRTLVNLLFRPGRVTVDYLEGRRARYSSPVNFYLLASFLFFAAAALSPDGSALQLKAGATRDELAASLEEAKAEASPEDRAELEELRKLVAPGSTPAPGGPAPEAKGKGLDELEAWLRQRAWIGPRLADHLGEVRRLPPAEASRRLRSAFAQNAPRVLFFLVPVMALALKLLWPRRFYAEHLVLSLHAQSMTYLALLPGVFFPAWNGPAVAAAALVWGPLALRRVYGCGLGAALGKGALLGLALSISLGLGLALAMLVAFLAM